MFFRVFVVVHKKSSSKKKDSLSPTKIKIIEMELELSKLNREKSVIVLNKAVFLYFCFLFLGILSIFTGYKEFFNTLIVMGLFVIIIGTIPYIKTMYFEEKKLKSLIVELRGN